MTTAQRDRLRRMLAEMCGLKPGKEWPDHLEGHLDGVWHSFPPNTFRPDEDIAQAVRCLEALGIEWAWTIRPREVTLTNIVRGGMWNPTHVVFTDSIPMNICLAIAAATGFDLGDE